MPADEYYEQLADRLASEQHCLGENDECEECGHPIRLHGDKYGCQYERGDAWVAGNQAGEPTVLMAQGPCGCQAWEVTERESSEEEVAAAIEQEQILEASRSVRRGNNMLFSAMKKEGVFNGTV